MSNLGQTQAALDEYATLFADGVGYPRAYFPYGELLASVGDWEKAKSHLLLAILRSPDNAAAYIALGKVHMNLGEYAFAKESLLEALKRAPNDTEAQQLLEQVSKK